MPRRSPHLPAPGLLGKVGDLDLVLLGLDLLDDHAMLRVRLDGSATARFLTEAEQESLRWQRDRAAGAREDPPVEPGVKLLETVDLEVEDDLGTGYRVARYSAGGTGREWNGEWLVSPTPPAEARTLRVTARPGDGRSVELQLPE